MLKAPLAGFITLVALPLASCTPSPAAPSPAAPPPVGTHSLAQAAAPPPFAEPPTPMIQGLYAVNVSACASLLDDPTADPVAHVWMTHAADSPTADFSIDRGEDLLNVNAARCVIDAFRAMNVAAIGRSPFTLGRTFRIRPHRAPDGVTATFDRSATAAALGGVVFQKCRADGAPTGSGHIKLTFASDGSVTNAQVDQPPFVGIPISECLEQALMGLRVPAFVEAPVTVGKSVAID